MSDIKQSPKSSPQPSSDERRSNEEVTSEQLEKEADEMAGAAGRVERRYDEDHDIFTK